MGNRALKKPDSTRQTTKWGIGIALLALSVATFRWLDSIKDRWYVLDPTFLHQLSQDAIRASASPNDTAGMITHILTNLTNTYTPTQIHLNADPTSPKEWVFNNAGGAMGAMYIIHASITEYLIIFGTPLGTEGHTGVLSVDNYFNILVGEQWAFGAGALEMERYSPGDVNFTPRGKTKQYKMHKGCFALEYSRGWIPPLLPFGLADAFTSTLDVPTIYRTVKITGREMIRNLMIAKI